MLRKKQNKDKRKIDNFLSYSSLGFEMAAIIIVGTWLGFKIDKWLQLEFKAFTLTFVILSVIMSIIYGVRNLLKK